MWLSWPSRSLSTVRRCGHERRIAARRVAWEALFPRALALMDDVQRYGGIAEPFWTFGGGTVLMFRYRHRLSKDIDIFVLDPQYLGFVTPRFSDTAADLTQDYTEMAGMFV